jgi:serine/threonine protein kinase/predicted negative regulator of RcsB-dependent stress response
LEQPAPAGVEGATIIEPVESITPSSETVAMAGGSGTGAWSKVADPTGSVGIAGGQAPLGPGSLLADRYEILQALGEGGMGAVYKARDVELDRIVALKVIKPELARNAEILQRFKRELILAREVTHRNVIRIFDLGVAGQTKFITMEFLEGHDLKGALSSQKFTHAQCVDIICQVCRGLEAAHAANVIHRDLKPQNIMIDQQGKVLVMDFGLAHSIEERGMTQTGALMGTPDFMSPEQARGEKADARSDIFSLGIIFYQMLTGKLPFESDTLMGTLVARTQRQAKPVREIDPQIPPLLNDIVAKCLATHAAERYQSVSELLADLEDWRAGVVGKTIRVPKSPRLRMIAPSTTWKFISISVSAGLVFLVLIAWLLERTVFSSRQAGAPVSLAILPFRNIKSDPALDWMGPELAAMLRTDVGQSSRLQTVPSSRITQILHDLRIAPDTSIDPETLRRIGDSTSADRMIWGQFAKFGDQIQIDATLQDLKKQRSFPLQAVAPSEKELPRAIEQLAADVQKSLALPSDVIKELQTKALKPSTQSIQALRYYNEGQQALHQGKNSDGLKSFQASIREDPNFALAYAKMGQAYANLGQGDNAEQAARKAVDLSEKLPAQEKFLIAAIRAQTANDNDKAIEAYQDLRNVMPDDPDVQFALAGLYNTVGAFDKSRDYYRQLLKRDPKYVEALYGIAGVEVNAGNVQASLDYLNRALPITIELENDQEKSAILYGLGMAYSQLNRADESLRNYQQALEIQRRLDDKRGQALTLNGMGQVQGTLGKSKEALASLEEALRLRKDLGDKTGVGDTLLDLSNFYEARGQNDQALAMAKQSLQIQREVGNQVNQATCLNNIGINYAEQGQYDDALTYFTQALGLREKLKDPTGIADSHDAMADALTKFGQYDQALTHYLRALELWRSVNDKRRAAFTSYGMGNLFEQQGRLGAALNAKEEALKTIRDVQDKVGIAMVLGSYGDSLNLLGRASEAQKSLEEAVALAREVKNDPFTGQNLNFQGDSFFYQGDFKTAKARYEQASQVASRTTDRRLTLVTRLNLAKVAVKDGHSRDAVNMLRKLADEADTQGLRYLSVECSVFLGEALMNSKDYSHARQELERALARSEKLGLQALQVKSHSLLATTLRLSGNTKEASSHYADARRILDGMRKESKSDTLLKRADFAAVFAESGKPPA